MEQDLAPALEKSTFGRLLRTHRAELGLSLAQLAARLHFDKGHVSKIETDKRPPSVSFARACDRVLESGDTFTSIAEALEAAGRAQPLWIRPAQLLPAHRNFVGRRRYLDRLDAALLDDGRSLGLPVAVIDGPPGVGKTALAVQWAQRAVDDGRFADGQLFVDLRGPAHSTAARPAAVLADLLRALGVPAAQVPADLEQRGAAFRTLLTGRNVLLVLDNAAETRQILPLLPGSRGCAVLITSRVRLPGLTSRVGADTLTLPELSAPEAIRLVRSIIGDERTGADPAAVALLADLCGHLPLALVRAAEQIVHHRHQSASALAAKLTSASARLDLAECDVTIRDVFDSTYALLDAASARVFRLLGRYPDDVITVACAAKITGVTEGEAVRLLRRLADVHLVRHRDEHLFGLNDLLRAYAVELTESVDTGVRARIGN
jgi:transcriptional regulator with XRE-family HTH domain